MIMDGGGWHNQWFWLRHVKFEKPVTSVCTCSVGVQYSHLGCKEIVRTRDTDLGDLGHQMVLKVLVLNEITQRVKYWEIRRGLKTVHWSREKL